MSTLLANPTAPFMETQFYQDYQAGKSQLQTIITDIQNLPCDADTLQTFLLEVTGLSDEYDLVFNTYADAAMGMYNALTDVRQCVAKTIGKDVLGPFQDQLATTAQDILDSKPVQELKGAIQNIRDAIDNFTLCDDVLNAIQQARNEANNQLAKVQQLLSVLDSFNSLVNDIAKALGIVSALINCVQYGASTMAYHASVFDPDNYEIINEVVSSTEDPNQKLIQAQEKIRQVKQVDSKINSFVDTLKI